MYFLMTNLRQGNTIVLFIIFLATICIYFYLKAILKNSKWWHEIERQWHEKKWLAIQKGDSQSKIASIVGIPDSIENENKDSEKVTWVYDCGSEGKRAITFKDGIIEKIEVKY